MESVINTKTKTRTRAERVGKPLPPIKMPQSLGSSAKLAEPKTDLLALLKKYDRSLPRYTSYPPATLFQSTATRRYSDHITRHFTGPNESELSLYVHLPFCDTLCYFCGCNMIISNNREKITEYISYLKREITMTRELMDSEVTVVQMHWGGGSPTHLTPEEIVLLGQHLRETFSFSDGAELSIEIDPRGLTPDHIAALKTVGFNRASIGAQDFEHDVQVAVNRIQSRELTEEAVRWCRGAGMTSVNLDLIYGLPFQTTQGFRDTLQAVRDISPDRIAVYNFAYVPWIKPHQRLIEIDTLPGTSSKLALFETAIDELTNAGYEYIGMDHFAKPTDTLVAARRDGTLHRNFQGYSTLAGKDSIAFGLSAIGRVENLYSQNVKSITSYYELIDDEQLPSEIGYELSPDDARREYVIMQIMCNLRVDKTEVERLFGISFDTYFARAIDALAPLVEDNLCEIGDRSITVTETGRYFLRNIAAMFDSYLDQTSGAPMYSRAL